jgi:ribosomal protein S18 acetylase RimI-like enzyme
MTIERASSASPELVEAVERLLPQLSPGRQPPTLEQLAEICAEPGSHLLVARDGDEIVGTLLLLLFRQLVGLRATIQDVVVDQTARGRGIGEALTLEAMRIAGEAGVERISLTSRSHREAAHRLYEKLGFSQLDTNVYVWRPQ